MKCPERILDLLFPPKCPFCGRVQERTGICAACEATLPTFDVPLWKGPDGVRCAAPLRYEDTVRDALLRMKFQGGQGMARPLGALIAQCAAEEFGGEFDVVTWVPVSRRRLRRRGYDQAELLCRAACRVWDAKPERLLEKTVDTPAQSGIKGMAARRANVLGVYEADAEKVRGRRVLLVDDICTTGVTLAECVRVLRDAGAERVVCAALARKGS